MRAASFIQPSESTSMHAFSMLEQSVGALVPECVLVITLVALLPMDLIITKGRTSVMRAVALIGCATALMLCLWQIQHLENTQALFSNHISLNVALRGLHAGLLLCAILSIGCFNLKQISSHRHTLCLISLLVLVLGTLLLTTANSLISLYIAIEITAIPAYILCMCAHDSRAKRIAFKYMLYGVLASAMMLFGASLFYAAHHSLFFDHALPNKVPLWLFLWLAALLFKLAIPPFHQWIKPVYGVLPLTFLSYLATGVKIAAWVAIARIGFHFQALPLHHWLWGAIATIAYTYGNIAALRAQNLRDLIAYSSIAYGGFLILPILQPNYAQPLLICAFLFYAIAHYLLFDSLKYLEKNQTYTFAQYPNLSKNTKKILLIPLSIALMALIGLPPTLGFGARWLIFNSLWTNASQRIENFFIIIALFNSIIAIFYYLRPLRALIYASPASPESSTIPIHAASKCLWALLAMVLIITFLLISPCFHALSAYPLFE